MKKNKKKEMFVNCCTKKQQPDKKKKGVFKQVLWMNLIVVCNKMGGGSTCVCKQSHCCRI